MKHGLKYITFCDQKHIALLAICYNSPLVCNKPLGTPTFVRLIYCHLAGPALGLPYLTTHMASNEYYGDSVQHYFDVMHVISVCSIMMASSNRNILPHNWPIVRGIHESLVDSPHKGQWCGVLMFSLICTWTNGWANTQDAGDLRCRHAHCDVTVMLLK